MAFIVKKGKRIEREIKFYDIYYVYMVVHIFIRLSPLKLNCVILSRSVFRTLIIFHIVKLEN